MNESIQRYDQLHTCGRNAAMTIEEANASGCNFYDNEATRQAFKDFSECFRYFCEEQNCIEGEPFAQEAPSIKPFLDRHKATRRPNRRLKIGVQAPPVITIGRKAEVPMEAPAAPRSLLKTTTKGFSPKATILKQATTAKVVETKPLEETMKELSVDSKDLFELFVKQSKSSLFKDAVFFVPKNYHEDFLKNKAEYVKRHGFEGKQQVLDKLVSFRSLMKAKQWNEANNIEIVSFTGRSHKVGEITFNFTSLNQSLDNPNEIPFIKMVSMAPLK